MRPSRRTLLIGLVTVLAFALPRREDAARAPAPRAAAQPERLTGTVSRFEARTRTVVLMTGVGHALRATRIHLPPGLMVKDRGGSSPVSVLTPGRVVRVECTYASAGVTASTVELLEAPGAAREP